MITKISKINSISQSFLTKSFMFILHLLHLWKIPVIISSLVFWPYWWVKPFQPLGDAAFFWYFHEFFDLGLKHGIDSLMYYGPWSIIYLSWFHQPTFKIMLLVQCFTSLCFAVGICHIVQRLNYGNIIKLILSLSIIGILSLSVDARFIVYLFITPLLYCTLDKKGLSFWFIIYLISLPFIALSKGTFSLLLISIFFLILIDELKNKKIPLYSIILVCTTTLSATLASHNPLDLYNYLLSIVTLSSFYGQVFGEYGSYLIYLCFILFSVIFGICILYLEYRNRKNPISYILTILCYAFFILVIIGTGFIRQDGEHMARSIFSIFPCFFLYLITKTFSDERTYFDAKKKFSKNTSISLYLPSFIFVVAVIAIFLLHPTIINNKLDRITQQIKGFVDIVFFDSQKTNERIKISKFDVANYFPYKNFHGSAILYVNGITPVAFSKINEYEVVPGISGNMNASGKVDNINAGFIKKSKKNYLIYEFNAQAPLSLSFLEMITKYKFDISKTKQTYHLLAKRKKPLKYSLNCKNTFKMRWNRNNEVKYENSDFMFLKINFKRTVLDRIFSSFYKPVTVYFKQYYENKELKITQIDNDLASNGFIIYPFYKEKTYFLEPHKNDQKHSISETISFKISYKKDLIHSIFKINYFINKNMDYQICLGNFILQ